NPQAMKRCRVETRGPHTLLEQRHQICRRFRGHLPLACRADRSLAQPRSTAAQIRLDPRQLCLEKDPGDLHMAI
ncbi:hypothetical protein, partial [Brachybacterium alimentarium]|uniref:hypothetical protein n=1 Tax=Brachybacterium alimentarium TaxID=47845 RepID=UPI003FD5B312